MRTASEKQQKQRQRTLEWQAKWLWPITFLFLFDIVIQVPIIFDKRSQWPFLLQYPPSVGISLHHSVWVNIFDVLILSLILVQWWVRVHNYRREQLAAEQNALLKAARPPDGVWPPPPVL